MTRQSAKQVIAFGTLAGFIAVSAAALLGIGEKTDLVFGAWVALATKAFSDYFGDTQEDKPQAERMIARSGNGG